MKSRTIIVIIASLLPLAVWALVPQRFQYQGSLSRPDGMPLDTTINLTLRLYDASSGGTLLWSEAYPNLPVRRGLFQVTMGTTTPLQQTYFMSGETYLGIVIGDDPEMVPRTRFVTVPYAYQVLTVDGAASGTLSGNLVVTGTITADTLVTAHGVRFADGTLQTSAAHFDTASLSDRIDAKADSADHATRTWVSGQITANAGQQAGDTNTYDATKSWVTGQGYLVDDDTISLNSRINSKADTVDNATRTWVAAQGYTAHAQAITDTAEYDATRSWVSGQEFLHGTDTLSLSSRINVKADTADHATRTWVTAQGYTAHAQAITDTAEYDATKSWVNGQGFLHSVDTLSLSSRINAKADSANNATRTWVTSQITASAGQQFADTNTYDATRAWVQSNGYLRSTSNVAGGDQSFVGGGSRNYARGDHSVVVGGGGFPADSNSATGPASFIGGGKSNISGWDYTVVVGGHYNTATGHSSAVIGGSYNKARGNFSVVCGGGSSSVDSNSASGDYSAILGGEANIASAEYATIGGGRYNKTRGQYSVVCGGGGDVQSDSNSASGNYSAVLGGSGNMASGTNSRLAAANTIAHMEPFPSWAVVVDPPLRIQTMQGEVLPLWVVDRGITLAAFYRLLLAVKTMTQAGSTHLLEAALTIIQRMSLQ